MKVGAAVILVAGVLTLGACSGSEPAPEATVPTPKGFAVPSGVTLTDPSTELAPGKPGTVVLEVGDGAASAVTLTVTKIAKGDILDFRFFSLDAASRASTPYYVKASVKNDGPAGIGGVGAPFVAHDDANTIVPPNVVNGEFKPCPGGTLPKSFLPGDTADLCMVFLVPKGRKLISVDARSDEPATAVRWKA